MIRGNLLISNLIGFFGSFLLLTLPILLTIFFSKILKAKLNLVEYIILGLFSLILTLMITGISFVFTPSHILITLSFSSAFIVYLVSILQKDKNSSGYSLSISLGEFFSERFFILILPLILFYFSSFFLFDNSQYLFLGIETPIDVRYLDTITPVGLFPYPNDALGHYLPIGKSIAQAQGYITQPTLKNPIFVRGPPFLISLIGYLVTFIGKVDGAMYGISFFFSTIAFLIVYKLFINKEGYYYSLILALISPYVLIHFKLVKEGLILLALFGMTFLYVKKYLEHQNSNELLFIAILVSLMSLTKESGIIIGVITFLFILYHSKEKKKVILYFSIAFLPVIIWLLRNLFLYGDPVFPYLSLGFGWSGGEAWYEQFKYFIRIFRSHLYSLPVIIPGLYFVYKYKERNISINFFKIQISALFVLSLFLAYPNVRYYLLPFFIPLIYFAGKFMNKKLSNLNKIKRKKLAKLTLIVIIAFLLICPVFFITSNQISENWAEKHQVLEKIDGKNEKVLFLGDKSPGSLKWYSDSVYFDNGSLSSYLLKERYGINNISSLISLIEPNYIIHSDIGDMNLQLKENYKLVYNKKFTSLWKLES